MSRIYIYEYNNHTKHLFGAA